MLNFDMYVFQYVQNIDHIFYVQVSMDISEA